MAWDVATSRVDLGPVVNPPTFQLDSTAVVAVV